MENPDIQHSFAMLGERIEKTAENPYGWIRQTAVNPEDTVCLVLGGQSTTTDSSVNHYCSEIEKLLNDNGLRQNVRIMGIINNYGSELNPETARTAQEISENRELKALFDVTRDSTPENLRALQDMALILKRKERGDYGDEGC